MNEIQNENPRRRMPRWLFAWLMLFTAIGLGQFVTDALVRIPSNRLQQLAFAFFGATFVLGLWAFVRWSCDRRNFGRALVGAAVLATLVAIFYLEEDWRGKRDWENCKRELEAKGAVLDWGKFIPPPVPDDQNFFTASSNILMRFKKAQTEAESAAQATNPWLHIVYSTNSFPVFDNAKTAPLVVANLNILPPSSEINRSTKFSAIALNDPAACERMRETIRSTVGRGANGAAGFPFSQLRFSNLQPAQIFVQAEAPPSIGDLEKLIPPDGDTILGRLRVVTTLDKNIFQIQLTGVRVTAAADYLKWSDQFVPAFDEVREALKRPCAMLPGDYSQSYLMPIPNFVLMRSVAQTLAQRTQCYLLLGQPEKALRELTLVHALCRILEKPPTAQPETLVEAMINVAISGLYAATVADGFRLHGWQEPQLAALQEQLKAINLPPNVIAAFKMEQAASVHTFETTPAAKIADLFTMVQVISNDHNNQNGGFWQRLKNPMYLFLKLAPRGWWYQNLVNVARCQALFLDGFDLDHGTISPRTFDETARNLNHFFEHRSPFKLLATIAIPNTARATQTTAFNQTFANEAQIVCALERYHLAHGEYPETLDALIPQFMEKMPHDLIGGQPLHYRRTEDGKFLIYSVGWNETDDGGTPGDVADPKKGDWVWHYSTQ